MKVFLLTSKIPWFGKYSGYECLPYYFPDVMHANVYAVKRDFISKLIGKVYQMRSKWSDISPETAFAGINFIRKIKYADVAHILYLEYHMHLLNKAKQISHKILGTVHLPFSQWKVENLKLLSQLKNAIILYKEEIERFGCFIPTDHIHFIRHGVDVNFFKPDNSEAIDPNKILFVGHYLRNFEMFLEVYRLITNEITDELEFHFIIPAQFRSCIRTFKEIEDKRNIYFHGNLSDSELLHFYQTSYVLLMPMQDSGANTAIIQSIASGLPVITTDVGGIRSYGGGDVFPVVQNNDPVGMTELFFKFYGDFSYRNSIAKAQRKYSLQYLDWKLIALEHYNLYAHIQH